MMRLIFLAILLSCLGACQTTPTKLPAGELTVKPIWIDPYLLADCDPSLAPLTGKGPNDVLDALSRSESIHTDCYARHHGLIAVVRQLITPTAASVAASAASAGK